MSVWKVTELHKGRKGSLTERTERKYTRVFKVFTNSKLDGPIEVMFAVDPNTAEAVPALYSVYENYGGSEGDILAICRSIDPVQDDDDWTVWIVTCEYSTESITGDNRLGQPSDGGNPSTGSGASNDPALEPPTQEWGEWHREQAQEREAGFSVLGIDFDGKAITTVAGEPFEPTPTREIGGNILIIERNELTYDATAKNAFRFTVNDGDFIWENDDRKWLCRPITARRQYKGSLKYWRVRYEFWHAGDLETWDHVLLHAGFLQTTGIVPIDGPGPDTKTKSIEFTGQVVSRPWPLSTLGRPLTPEQIFLGKDINYLTFKKYLSKSFTGLNIVVDD